MQHPRPGEAWSVMFFFLICFNLYFYVCFNLYLFVCFNLYFFADKLTNHCLHCHVFTKAPLPCEVDDLCNSSTLHIRHAHMFHSSYTYMSIHALCTPDMLCRGVLLEGLPQEGEPGLSQVKVQISICKNTCRRTRKASQGYHRFY